MLEVEKEEDLYIEGNLDRPIKSRFVKKITKNKFTMDIYFSFENHHLLVSNSDFYKIVDIISKDFDILKEYFQVCKKDSNIKKEQDKTYTFEELEQLRTLFIKD